MVRKASASADAALVTAAYCADSVDSAVTFVLALASRTKKRMLAATRSRATTIRTTFTPRHEVLAGPVAVDGSLTRRHRAGQHPLPRVVTEHRVQSSPVGHDQRASVTRVDHARAGIVRGDTIAVT